MLSICWANSISYSLPKHPFFELSQVNSHVQRNSKNNFLPPNFTHFKLALVVPKWGFQICLIFFSVLSSVPSSPEEEQSELPLGSQGKCCGLV